MDKNFYSLYPKEARFKEIEEITSFIRQGSSVQIIGLPGVGRSNLLGLLSYNHYSRDLHFKENQKFVHFVLADFSEIKEKEASQVYKFLFLSLLTSLKERKMEREYLEISAIFEKKVALNDEMVLFQGLKEAVDFLAIENKLSLIFLFDKFEYFVNKITPDFFSNLKILRNRAKYRFSIVFSVERPLEDILDPFIFSSFYELFVDKTVFIPILDKPGLDFRISYLQKNLGKQIDPELAREVKRITNGHGKLTRICLEEIMDFNQKDLQVFLLGKKAVKAALFEIWNFLRPEEKQMLIKKDFSSQFLEKIELVENGKINIPLFEKFLETVEQYPEKISFNKETKQIFLGKGDISNNLTANEFRLLEFLMQNEAKLITKEEIVNVVWTENKTIQGVSDQAIDQLISRLRKKIELNPNSPKHLTSIKGRGIIFNS